MFEAHGSVRSVIMAKHFESGRGIGVGFIEMASEDAGSAAIVALNHREHEGRILLVSWREYSKDEAAQHEQMFGPMNMMNDD